MAEREFYRVSELPKPKSLNKTVNWKNNFIESITQFENCKQSSSS